MELLLKANVKGLGKEGQKVVVNDGYARNFLIPKGLAVPATETHLQQRQRENQKQENIKQRKLKDASELAAALRNISCSIVRQAGENDKLYGSVTVQDIMKSLEEEGITLEKKQILLDEPIKKLGIYSVKVRLAQDIESVLKVWVVNK